MAGIPELLGALTGSEWGPARDALKGVEAAGEWRAAFEAVRNAGSASAAVREGFHTLWTEKGHRIREGISDDNLLLGALRALLPPYSGEGATLFRGESVDRWKAGKCGLCWSAKEGVARMFASGLNAYPPAGGVLLRTTAPASAIIASPGAHSLYLGEFEYVLDWRGLDICVMAHFPPV